MIGSLRVAALAVCLVPPFAVADGVRITGAALGMPVENDFSQNLPGVLISGATLALTEPARLIFTPVAAESGNHHALTVAGLGTLSEDRDFGFRRGGRGQITGNFAPGSLDGILIFTSDFGDTAVPGSDSFGVFVDGAPGEAFTTFFLVYDDTNGTDGDFDDYIIRVDVEALE
ncbi:MAG: hypothetical protein AAFR50_07450 [Pseudomonadota bacterium]